MKMEIFNINDNLDNIPKLKNKIDLCLGYFDGVHIAHQRLINRAVGLSSLKTGIITFINSTKNRESLTSLDGRLALFKILNIDYVFVFSFSKKFKNITKEEFKERFLDVLPISTLVCGKDFTFGKNREGDITYLKKFYKVKIIPFFKKENKKISSLDISTFLKKGNIKKANTYLGRRYQIRGKVRSGYKHGHDLNFPTANISFASNYVVPLYGVYKVLIYINGIPYLGIANVGVHPTVNKLKKPIIEVHIPKFSGDLYGKYVYVEFVDFIRKEKKFSSEKTLIKQINKDIASLSNWN